MEEKIINKSDIIFTGAEECLIRKKQDCDKKICNINKKAKLIKYISLVLTPIVGTVIFLFVYKVMLDEIDIGNFINNSDPFSPGFSLCIAILCFLGILWLLATASGIIIPCKDEIKIEEIYYKELETEIKKIVNGTATVNKITLSKENLAKVYFCYINEDKQFVEENYEFSLKFERSSEPAEYQLFRVDFDKEELTYFSKGDNFEPDSIFGDYKVAKEVK